MITSFTEIQKYHNKIYSSKFKSSHAKAAYYNIKSDETFVEMQITLFMNGTVLLCKVAGRFIFYRLSWIPNSVTKLQSVIHRSPSPIKIMTALPEIVKR